MDGVLAIARFWLPIAIFVAVFVGMFLERIEKALVTGLGAAAVLLLGLVPQSQAFAAIDFETLALLFGMMVIVEVTARGRLFALLSTKILRLTGGRPLLIFVLFVLNTLILSSVLSNVTTILIILPLTIEITAGIGLNPRPFLVAEIVAANVGGLLTLIGDPVNTIVGSAVGIGMFEFGYHLGIPVAILTALTLLFLRFAHRAEFKDIRGDFLKVLHNMLVITAVEERFEKFPVRRSQLWISGGVLAGTILGFAVADRIGLTPGVIALIGGVAALTLTHKTVPFHKVMEGVEWQTLIFFAGLFVVVGALESTGVLEMIAAGLAGVTTDPYVLLGILLVGTAVVSAVVDNVPFVTMMIPVMQALLAAGLFAASPQVVWWTLSLGAVIGGLASPYGSSANIVAVGVARKAGVALPTGAYLRYSLPISAVGLLISYAYLVAAYEL